MPVHRNTVRTLFLTYSQCPVERERLLEHIQSIQPVKEYVIARELHQDGQPHLHAYIKFEGEGLRTTQFTPTLDCDGYHGNYQAARSHRSVISYCTKDGAYITNLSAEVLETPQAKRRKTVHDIISMPVTQLLVEGHIPYQQAKNVVYVRNLLLPPYEHDHVRGVWIYGPPGTGKSHMARHNYPGPLFIKSQNKWWDNYAGEPTILLDDFDCGKPLGHYLKIWADKWACQGEIKGGTVQLQHRCFIVTSNYSIEDMFAGDLPMIAAIKRRFEVIHKTSR